MNTPPIDINRPLARGRTADIYEWGDEYVLKLFHDWFSLENIEYEMKIAQAVYASGVQSPAVKELTQVYGRRGLVYQRARGDTMRSLFQRAPWKALSLARVFAQFHAQMHSCVCAANIPPQHEILKRKILSATPLRPATKISLLDRLHSLPAGDRVCHGDFHPDNILISPVTSTVIDWIDASNGNPLADVARTSIILLGALAARQISNPVIRIFVGLFHTGYIKEYFRLRPQGRLDYQQWLPIVAAARLSENITDLEPWLLAQADHS
ncbi:MAG: aminoglycoside phosphotransferase family protein [Chloroflexi bacterium CFX1]|nr:aminoglycoside phosphotransferase family protein [Chloroflexi bacterium CFX1]NUQ60624.1 aminoglycoside phosphotransferase family protein [Anaerolineales bacterium]